MSDEKPNLALSLECEVTLEEIEVLITHYEDKIKSANDRLQYFKDAKESLKEITTV